MLARKLLSPAIIVALVLLSLIFCWRGFYYPDLLPGKSFLDNHLKNHDLTDCEDSSRADGSCSSDSEGVELVTSEEHVEETEEEPESIIVGDGTNSIEDGKEKAEADPPGDIEKPIEESKEKPKTNFFIDVEKSIEKYIKESKLSNEKPKPKPLDNAEKPDETSKKPKSNPFGDALASEIVATLSSTHGEVTHEELEIIIDENPKSTDPLVEAPSATTGDHRPVSVQSKEALYKLDFPKKIWQKTGPRGLDNNAVDLINQWLDHNPDYRHEILSDASGDAYVRDRYSHRPDIVELYTNLTVPIVKADFLRQLILYADGGLWSDLDVACERAIEKWIPTEYKDRTNAVVGIEFDGWQFASWTVMAKPGLVHFANVIDYIMEDVQMVAEAHNVTTDKLEMSMIPDVVDTSGPQAMTVGILESLSKTEGRNISYADIEGVRKPKLLGDVLVLPPAAFAALQYQYPKDQGPILVEHQYAGSWKNGKGGEKR